MNHVTAPDHLTHHELFIGPPQAGDGGHQFGATHKYVIVSSDDVARCVAERRRPLEHRDRLQSDISGESRGSRFSYNWVRLALNRTNFKMVHFMISFPFILAPCI